MWTNFSQYLAALLVTGMAVFLLVHFGLIGYYKSIVISEPNPYIFWAEVAIMVVILAFGVYLAVRTLRKSRAK